jgi:hypothetical protein
MVAELAEAWLLNPLKHCFIYFGLKFFTYGTGNLKTFSLI